MRDACIVFNMRCVVMRVLLYTWCVVCVLCGLGVVCALHALRMLYVPLS